MKTLGNVTLGCDPEVFVVDNTGTQVPICEKIGGTKEEPLQMEGLAKGFAYQEDNVMAEFCVPPAGTAQEFSNNVQTALDYIQSNLLNKLGLKIDISASKYFRPDQLDHPQAEAFGCSPDYNAYTGEEARVKAEDAGTLRTCGGHIHVGAEHFSRYKGDIANRMLLMRAMDLFIGIPSLILDKDTDRRRLYGYAGCFRPKPYGAEYRTVSNFWTATDKLRQWAFNNTMRAIEFMLSEKGQFLQDANSAECQEIRDIINYRDMEKAKRYCKLYSLIEEKITA